MWIIVWLILSILVGVYANSKGKSGILYFFISITLSPLLGFIIALVSGDATKKKCSNCGQEIDINAKVCPFCNNSFSKNTNVIKQLDKNTNRLVLNKEKTSYKMEDLKRIVSENYNEDFRAKETLNTNHLYTLKGTAGEYPENYIQIQSKENDFVIDAYNTTIPKELENNVVKDNRNKSSNNVDRLIELGKLYKDGILTKEEFEEQKELLKKES